MVVLAIIAPSSEHTVYFNQPMKKPNYIRLLSCTFYNSWHNLKKKNRNICPKSGMEDKRTFVDIEPGYYTPKSLLTTTTEKFAERGVEFFVNSYTPKGALVFLNPKLKQSIGLPSPYTTILFDVDDNQIYPHITVERFASPSTYFIHCDLVDKEQNLLNGKPLTVLARFDVRGEQFEKVHYQTAQQHVLRDTSTGYHVNSLTISVRDENGALFDFQGLPLEFELGIN